MKIQSLVLVAALALGACHSSSSTDGGSGGPGSECTATTDCQSGVCIFASANAAIGFCSAACLKQADCAAFTGGCCVPTQDGDDICAIAELCTDGDAGLGDPCPAYLDGGGNDECALGLICLHDSAEVITECSQPCQSTADCEGIPQECCEDLNGGVGAVALACVLDPTCGEDADAGPTVDAGGTLGPGGDDGGPFYASLSIDGELIADTNAFQGSVGPGFDSLTAPPLASNLELDLHSDLALGIYACDGGGSALPADAGNALYAVASTDPTNSPSFAALLPQQWQGLHFILGCGGAALDGNPSLIVQAASVEVDAFTPGVVRSLDAGAVRGHVTGSSYWRVGTSDGGGQTLEVRERFDVDLTPP